MRRKALELMARTIDDLTNLELVTRATDELWYLDLCLDTLHRLPSEVDTVLLCREYTALQARGIIKQAQERISRVFQRTGG